ncbi:TPA: hypothetical protein MBF27_003537 [Klebsiella pneumoniae]|jgi:hypothetical protein|uniref:hypothetical protein n=1 Tax=Klebsiella pneumoniae TaxID=573 RepID=UPI000A3B8D4F|nr:hypothetical protein [Klebsiella pneumoniae]HDT4677556.1 hypothetical protein [Klebsiella pneumoniae subsp. pneumoniae]EKU1336371.1 hypothetical protein [Klebsiella pneumoniae]MBD7084518.1 hypothetical protein [Klebsiella pneumoniae]MBG1786783.1 hypothetical protein [Klebsiella pneumoniae]MCB3448047.1 hypothetical protein [Klebsiella pneumoniae]
MAEIILPANNWTPRPHQRRAWAEIQGGKKRAALCWPRRYGKDDFSLHMTACKAFERVGNYAHSLPQANQVRKAIWKAINPRTGRLRIDEAFPHELRRKTLDNEMMIEFINGSTWQAFGSDNYGALIGSGHVGIVFSEWALSNPSAWAYLRPILADNGGWAFFVSTPRGKNHFYKMFQGGLKDPENWFCDHLSADITGHIPPETLAQELREMQAERGEEEGLALFNQEYMCDWNAAVPGAYYSSILVGLEKAGQIGNVPWDPQYEVYTSWDLGIGDATAIWFYQFIGKEVRVIDYYESSGVGLEHYVKILREKPYTYAERHFFPHDVRARELSTGASREETLGKLGIRCKVLPATSVDDGISEVRMMLRSCWFDKTKCEKGLEALGQYQKEWDDTRKMYKPTPLHNWTSHGADSFRYGAVGSKSLRSGNRHTTQQFAQSNYDPYNPPGHSQQFYADSEWDLYGDN